MGSRISGFGDIHQGGGDVQFFCMPNSNAYSRLSPGSKRKVAPTRPSVTGISGRNQGIKGHRRFPASFSSLDERRSINKTMRGGEPCGSATGLSRQRNSPACSHQPDLRLFDCTTYLEYQPEGSGVPYIAVPGRHTFEAGHIPGADFLDLQGEFSDQNTELRFMMPRSRSSRPRSAATASAPTAGWCSTRSARRCGRRGSGGC